MLPISKEENQKASQTEERLREQAEILDAVRDAIIVQGLDGRVLFWNRAAERIYGWTQRELQNLPISDPGDDSMLARWAQKFTEIRPTLLENGEWNGEMENFAKDGRKLIVECRCNLMTSENGDPKSILIINTDITEKKRFEAQVLQLQRMESVGALASGIAHDLNNWLSPILTSIHTLQQRFTDPNSQKWLSIIRKSAERCRDLVDHVLTFARGKEGERTPLSTIRLISDVAKIVNETLPKGVAIEVDVPRNVWAVIGDATQIHQVLMNLCLNARDAMPGGGTLSLSATNIVLSTDDVWMIEGVRPGKYVQISVTDTGLGMNQELIDRAFEPFFTTKKDGLGTGLGLSIALGIVRSHDGFINVASAIGQGAQFNVHLPASEVVLDDRPTFSEMAAQTGAGELILVADDEEDIREITVSTLDSCGYRSIGAGAAEELLALIQAHPEAKLIIADLSLQGLTQGFFTNSIFDQVKIIGASGLRSSEQIEAARKAGVETILWKPYTAQQLLIAIEKKLNAT
jgi:two-component system cell cycle sensor histidine kinase/response regulator CckA